MSQVKSTSQVKVPQSDSERVQYKATVQQDMDGYMGALIKRTHSNMFESIHV
jgi:hypothetical protein